MSDLPHSDERARLPLSPARRALGSRAASGFVPVPSDGQVIRRVLAGEVGVFAVLMRRYGRRLFRVIRSIVRAEREAQEVLEEVFLQAHEDLARFRGQGRLSTWLSHIAIAAADGHARRRSAFVRLASRIAGLFEDDRRLEPSPLGVDGRNARSRVEATLAELPASTCTVLVMREVEGMSTAETADCLGVSEEAIHMRLLRARAFLHGRLSSADRRELPGVFDLADEQVERIVEGVLWRLRYGR